MGSVYNEGDRARYYNSPEPCIVTKSIPAGYEIVRWLGEYHLLPHTNSSPWTDECERIYQWYRSEHPERFAPEPGPAAPEVKP